MKYLYCPECKEYPDEVVEVYEWYVERREWNGKEYETIDSTFGTTHYECNKCSTQLINK